MRPFARNLMVWIAVLVIVAVIWFLAARTHLQFVDSTMFLMVIAGAAAALTALLWWEIATDSSDDGREDPFHTPTGDYKP